MPSRNKVMCERGKIRKEIDKLEWAINNKVHSEAQKKFKSNKIQNLNATVEQLLKTLPGLR